MMVFPTVTIPLKKPSKNLDTIACQNVVEKPKNKEKIVIDKREV